MKTADLLVLVAVALAGYTAYRLWRAPAGGRLISVGAQQALANVGAVWDELKGGYVTKSPAGEVVSFYSAAEMADVYL